MDLNLLTVGNPDLYRKAHPVENPQQKEIKLYILEMERILKEQKGLALAAPQVNIPYQIIIMGIPQKAPNPRYDFDQDPNHKEFPLTTMINPEYQPITEQGESVGWESCLSVPGYRGKVKRYNSIKCSWKNIYGESEHMRVNGFNARVFQHEYDHLLGKTYIERMDDLKTFTFIGLD